MDDALLESCTAFDGVRRLCSGPLIEVALAVKNAADAHARGPLLLFSDTTGRVFDIDTRGSKQEVIARLERAAEANAAGQSASTDASASGAKRQRGRPRLGVVGHEVTLLPKHWEWLNAQPGGASVTLRKLVARASRSEDSHRRAACDAAYHFMYALAGDLPGFEAATRALYADDREGFEASIESWPGDVRDHALRLAYPNSESASAATG